MDYKIEDLITIETRCKYCDTAAQATTFSQLAQDETKPLGAELKKNGYFGITCEDCYQKENA